MVAASPFASSAPSDVLATALARAQADGLEANVERLYRFLGSPALIEAQVLEAKRHGSTYVNHLFAFALSLDDLTRLARQADDDPHGHGTGVYVIGNTLDGGVVSRAAPGAWAEIPKSKGTSDRDVTHRRVLFLDCDYKRPTGTSATDAGVRASLEVATRVLECIDDALPADSIAIEHSGNGYQVHIALDDLPETPELASLVKGILAAASERFSTSAVKIDSTVSDAKRLSPLTGTMKRKGAANVPGYPHRRTAIVCADVVTRASFADLEALFAHLRNGLSSAQLANVDRAMGVRAASASSTRSSTATGDDAFARAKAVPMIEVLERLGLYSDRPICCGCGLSDSGVALVSNGLKCSHDRCSAKGAPGCKGFRTTIDVVMEARSIEAGAAVDWLADEFGFAGRSPRARQANDNGGARTKKRREPREGVRRFQRGDHAELAATLAEELSEPGLTVFDDGALYRYGDETGLWMKVEANELSIHVQRYSGADIACDTKPLRLRASDVAGTIKLAGDRLARPRFFRDAPDGLAFANGFVSVDAKGIELVEHMPENRARAGFDFAFTGGDPAPRWEACVADAFRDDDDAAEKIAFIQEFGGACLLGIATRYQRAVVWLGEGANAKSTIIRVLTACMPKGTTTTIPPQDFGQEYRRAMLIGARLNVVSELPEADLLESESFKAIVSGDAIIGRPIREAPVSFTPIAGHLFAANKLPGTTDLTHGFWRRLVVIRFGRVFQEHEQIASLPDDIIATEREAVVAWFLEGARRLLARGGYVVPPSSNIELGKWRQSADNVSLFLQAKTVLLQEGERGTPARDFYDAYAGWARGSGFKPVNVRNFAHRMDLLGFGSKRTNTGAVYPLRVRTFAEGEVGL